MKRVFLLLMTLGMLALTATAIPADPTPVKVTQPDGSTVTVRLHGDEFFHLTQTLDGYTLVKDASGYYTYARQDQGGRLVSSGIAAHDVSHRSGKEMAALAGIPKGLNDKPAASSGARRLSSRNQAMRRVGADGLFDYDSFRGLIILINYTDKKFSMSEAGNFYSDMVNTHDYTGYTMNGRRVNMTGSVRDYFYDNSNHIFDPHFDVVGPVNVNFKCTDPKSSNNAEPIFQAALAAVDSLVNYQDYDTDGDGYVDMVFFLVAGYAANYGGNNDNYLWPHMYYLYRAPMLDNVGFGLYACSTEIAGWENSYSGVNGIGTFCHEFGHVLGLPDLYDTDYESGGGQSRDPGEWSIMAGGSGNNFGRNPVGYSLYERYALGFTHPVKITGTGELSLDPLDESNIGYRLNTNRDREFFLIENRQQGKWDRYLPGHGMMIAHVDSTNRRIWEYNEVNCNPSHMCYDLLRASYKGQDSGSDPFPGKEGVTSITNFTKPNLMSWDKSFSEYVFYNITEQDRHISFEVKLDTAIKSVVEDFELLPATEDQNAKGVQGVYSQWDFAKCAVVSYEEGNNAVAMKTPSQVATSFPISIIPYLVRYTIHNPTNKDAKFLFYYSTDRGEKWNTHSDGQVTVPAGEDVTVSVSLPTDDPVMFRIAQTSGHNKSACYLDNILLYYEDYWPEPIKGDLNEDTQVNISDLNQMIEYILSGNTNRYMGHMADLNGDGSVTIGDVNMLISIIMQQ